MLINLDDRLFLDPHQLRIIDLHNMPKRGTDDYWDEMLSMLADHCVVGDQQEAPLTAFRVAHDQYGEPGVLDLSALLLLYVEWGTGPDKRLANKRPSVALLRPETDILTPLSVAALVDGTFNEGGVAAETGKHAEHAVAFTDGYRHLMQRALNVAGGADISVSSWMEVTRSAVRRVLGEARTPQEVATVFVLAQSLARANQ